MEKIAWTVTEANGSVKTVSSLDPLPYCDAVEITANMAKGQKQWAELFNMYRERLILLGEIKTK